MRYWTWMGNLFRTLWRRKEMEAELDDELREHFEQEVADRRSRGMTPEAAYYEARRLMGEAELHKEGARDAMGITFFETLRRDAQFAVRTFRRTPLFAATAVFTLALGIGANSTVFTFIENILMRGPKIQDPTRVATLAWDTGVDMSYLNYVDLRDRNSSFSGLAGDRFGPVNMSLGAGNNLRLWGYEVTGNYFDVLGVQPQLGRAIEPIDDAKRGAGPVLVISDKLWRDSFASDRGVVGRVVKVNGFPFTIIGVAPPGFGGTELIVGADYWVPISMVAEVQPGGGNWLDVRVSENLWALGRLKAGVTMRQAEADLDRIVGGIARAYPNDVEAGTKVHLAPTGLVGKAVRDPISSFSVVLLIIAGSGLLLACVNLAGMLLARASARRREIGIRLAIGASRRQLLRQLLTESLLLAVCGGTLGLAIAWGACRALNAVHFDFGIPFSVQLQLDWRVILFGAALTVATALAFGLLPALQAVKRDVARTLHNYDTQFGRGGIFRSGWTLRDAVVSTQVALSVLLVVCSLLVVKSLQHALDLKLGLRPEGAFAVTADLTAQGYDEARSIRFRKELLARARALPGVKSAGIINSLPLNLAGLESDYYMPVGAPVPELTRRRVTQVYNISDGYFEAAGTRLLRGRDIATVEQTSRHPEAVVNEAAAEQLFPKGDAIGRSFRLSLNPEDPGFEIVGIVETGKYRSLNDQKQPAVFVPINQVNTSLTTLVVRSGLSAGTAAGLLRKTALALDPQLTLFQAGTLTEQLALPLFPARVAAIALGTFGGLALVLAATGLFALVAFAVARRGREINIRKALGATSSQILQTLMWRIIVSCGAGLAVGLGITFFASRLLAAVLYGVNPHDLQIYALAVGVLVLVATAACWNPAARALRLDPAATLREE